MTARRFVRAGRHGLSGKANTTQQEPARLLCPDQPSLTTQPPRGPVPLSRVSGTAMYGTVGLHDAQAWREVGVQVGCPGVLGGRGVDGHDPGGLVMNRQVCGVPGGSGAEVAHTAASQVAQGLRTGSGVLAPGPVGRCREQRDRWRLGSGRSGTRGLRCRMSPAPSWRRHPKARDFGENAA